MEGMIVNYEKVSCPHCLNSRLLDVSLDTVGSIELKCPRCHSIIRIYVRDRLIHAIKK